MGPDFSAMVDMQGDRECIGVDGETAPEADHDLGPVAAEHLGRV